MTVTVTGHHIYSSATVFLFHINSQPILDKLFSNELLHKHLQIPEIIAAYNRFFSTPKADTEFDEICKNLVEASPDSKKLVLTLKDQEAEFCDNTAFAAFVTGFRLAAGIACELKDEWYSFYDEIESVSAS